MAQAATPRRVVHFGVFELDFGTGELRKAGLKIKLQDQPFQVLAMLLENPGELVTREELLQRLWPSDTFVDFDHGLNVAVKKLRRALGDSAENPKFVETLARRGYRFVGQIDNVVPFDAHQAITSSHGIAKEPLGHTLVLASRTPSVVPGHPKLKRLLAWAAVAVLTVITSFVLLRRWSTSPAPRVVTRFTIPLPPSEEFSMERGGLAISPDGGYLVYSAAASKTGTQRLYLRPLDRNEATPIPGTEEAIGPFFSPDGQWIAFTAGGELRKVPLHGGSPIKLCAKGNPTTGTWGPDGAIFFTEGSAKEEHGQLMRVAAAGGTPQAITPAEKSPTEFPPRWPQVLPAGNAVLYVTGGTWASFSDDATIVAQSLKTGERKILIQGGASPRYVSPGYLVYAQGGRLLAVPFDAGRIEVTGAAFPVAEDVWQGPGGYAAYDISRNGLLVSLSSGENSVGNRTLSWVDRTGTSLPINFPARQYSQPSLSPDGKHVAVAIGDPQRQSDIWILDLAQNVARQATFSQAGQSAAAPLWTPDGKRIIYASGSHGRSLFWQAADGSGEEELLFSSNLSPFGMILSMSCSPDGRFLVFQRGDPRGFELWVLNLAGNHKISPLPTTGFDTQYPQISPDGRRLAYTSDESGRPEVYVQAFPKLSDKSLISLGGGEEPRWSRNGRQLFYRQHDKMMIVDMGTMLTRKGRVPQLMFEGRYARSSLWTNYDMAADGQRFLMLQEEDDSRANQVLRVVLNWTDELKRPRAGKN
ncbi:MAG TPA: winged helix-turn-helix domain-containing protein [Terriglobales bacterium]|nr:winged helix-turn-helix domain-containing protein [Terriglobales bacterium]